MSESTARRHAEGVALAAFAALTMGGGYAVARMAFATGTDPLTVTLVRVILLVATFWLLCRWAGRRFRLPGPAFRQSVVLGAILCSGFYCNMASVQYLPVALAVLIYNTYPMMIVGLEAVWFWRRPPPAILLALGAALIGLAMLLGVGFGAVSLVGVLIAFWGGWTGAISTFWIGHKLAHVPVQAMLGHMMIVGSVGAAIAVAILGGPAIPSTAAGWGWALAVLFFQFVCVPAYWVALPRIGPVMTGAFQNLVPVVGTVGAYFLYDEALTVAQLAGGALVIAAVTALVILRGREAAATPPPRGSA
jgi:drug/metabolite transporter (DMT)-like permease